MFEPRSVEIADSHFDPMCREWRVVESPGFPTGYFPFGLRDFEILLLKFASEGFVDKKIAELTGKRPEQVHEQWRRIRRVMEAGDRSHAVAIALSLGLIPPPARAMALAGGRLGRG